MDDREKMHELLEAIRAHHAAHPDENAPLRQSHKPGEARPPESITDLKFVGRGWAAAYCHATVYADAVTIRVDDERDAALWCEIRIRPGRLAAWLSVMGYTVTEPAE